MTPSWNTFRNLDPEAGPATAEQSAQDRRATGFGYNAAMPLALLLLALLAPTPAAEPPMKQIEQARGEGKWEVALKALRDYREKAPELYRLNDLPYLEALVELESGNGAAAEGIFSRLLESDFPFPESVLLHLLRLRDKEPLERREPLYKDFLAKHSEHSAANEIRYRYAADLEKAGRLAEAKTQFDWLWRRGPRPWSRKAALRHALLHLSAGEPDEALSDLKKLLVKSESDDVAFRAAREIHRLQAIDQTAEIEGRRLARTFLNNRQADLARAYLVRLVEDFPRSLSADQYGYLLGRSYVIQGEYGPALAAYADNYRRHPKSTWGIFSKYLTANTALRARDYRGAERSYRDVIRDHPESKYARRAYYHLADTLLWLKEPDEARRTILEGIRKAPSERRALRYQLARFHLQRSEWAEALEQLERLDGYSSARLSAGVTREEIHYWKGLCLEKLGRSEEAQKAYRTAAGGRLNYFSNLASLRFTPGADDFPAAAPDWSDKLLSPRGLHRTAGEKKAFMASDPAARIRSLLFLGLFDEAAREIGRTSAKSFPGGSIDRLLNLAYWADRGRLPAESLAAAEKLESYFRGKELEEYPAPIRSLLYPRHYWMAVKTYGERYGVEPELILSVIRQESRFQADALSPAAARGLMQFTRSTARQLASELKIPAPSDADLYRPELSIQLGAYYLSKLIRRFDGSVEKALAAYNGGAENVKRWSAKLENPETALFVANIGYRETKLYVLRVMGNYHAYRRVHGDASGVARGAAAPNLARDSR